MFSSDITLFFYFKFTSFKVFVVKVHASFLIMHYYELQARTGKLSEKGVKFVGSISGWTATLLFMWMPVSQMVSINILSGS